MKFFFVYRGIYRKRRENIINRNKIMQIIGIKFTFFIFKREKSNFSIYLDFFLPLLKSF